MKRKNAPTCILSADWHISLRTPLCRSDDYKQAQREKIEFVTSLARKYECSILLAGDVGDGATWGDELLNWTFEFLGLSSNRNEVIAVPGQHDLLYHRIDKCFSRGLGVLNRARCVRVLDAEQSFRFSKGCTVYPYPYSCPIRKRTEKEVEAGTKMSIALIHQMVIKSQKDVIWPGQVAVSAKQLLKRFPEYNLIVSGDNHQPFVVEYEGRLLVNPGSLMRITAKQIDLKPRVYLWYAKENKVEPVYLPIKKGVISRKHLEKEVERDKRLVAYVKRLKDNYEIGMSFEKNAEEYFNKNPTHESVEERVWKGIIE